MRTAVLVVVDLIGRLLIGIPVGIFLALYWESAQRIIRPVATNKNRRVTWK